MRIFLENIEKYGCKCLEGNGDFLHMYFCTGLKVVENGSKKPIIKVLENTDNFDFPLISSKRVKMY